MTWLRFFRKASIPCLLLFNWKERREERFFFSFFLLGKQTWDARNIDAPLGDRHHRHLWWGQTSGFRVQVLLMQPHASSRGRVKAPGCKSAQYSCKSLLLRLCDRQPQLVWFTTQETQRCGLCTQIYTSVCCCACQLRRFDGLLLSSRTSSGNLFSTGRIPWRGGWQERTEVLCS